MPAMESFSGFATAPGATPTAITLSNGTLTVRQFNQQNAYLFDTYSNGQASNGYWRIRSPKFHDNVQGLRFSRIFGATRQCYPFGWPQQVTAQDTLIVEDLGSAVGGEDFINPGNGTPLGGAGVKFAVRERAGSAFAEAIIGFLDDAAFAQQRC